MKIRTYIVVAVVVALILAAVWWLRTSRRSSRPKSTANVQEMAGTAVTAAAASSMPPATNKSIEAVLAEKAVAYKKGVITKTEAMKKIWDLENTRSMDCYGKVIDQYKMPVAGAMVKGSIMYNMGWDSSRNEAHITQTDADGRFKFTGLHGASIGVAPSLHGYEFDLRKAWTWTDSYKANPENPIILTMWKLKGPEPMIHANVHAYIPCGGTSVSYDLLTGKKATGDGDLIVKLLRNPVNIARGKPFDWSVTLEIPNGGFTEIADMYPYEAPADGYQSSVTTNMPADMKNWDAVLTRSFYFKCRNGQAYGRMTINIQADFQPPPTLFDADIYVNLSGSRNLEFDRAKQINP